MKNNRVVIFSFWVAKSAKMKTIPLQKPQKRDFTISPTFFCPKARRALVCICHTFAMSKQDNKFIKTK